MTVKELIKELIDLPIMATVEIEVPTDNWNSYSCSEDIKVVWVSDNRVVIMEKQEG